jgi:hypothetical protein
MFRCARRTCDIFDLYTTLSKLNYVISVTETLHKYRIYKPHEKIIYVYDTFISGIWYVKRL